MNFCVFSGHAEDETQCIFYKQCDICRLAPSGSNRMRASNEGRICRQVDYSMVRKGRM
jgi:hypothetical protein